jgi:TusA-related sulfurtransferase
MGRYGAAVLVLFLVGCGGDTAPAPSSSAKPAGSAPATASAAKSAASSAAPAPSAAASGGAAGKMVNCANAVAGAKTTLKDVDKGIEITIVSEDGSGTDEIKKRAKDSAEKGKEGKAGGAHSGQGGGGGGMGRCPIVLVGTDVTVADADKGAKVTVLAKDAAEVDWLRRETRERLAAMEDPGAADSGERKMANCPSIVSGATTTVKEVGGKIVVVVTAKDAAATTEIRERGKKVVAHPLGSERKHGGSGLGGGKGRCPLQLEGTKPTVKEVDGGIEVTLELEKGADLKKLVAEAQDRAKPLSP